MFIKFLLPCTSFLTLFGIAFSRVGTAILEVTNSPEFIEPGEMTYPVDMLRSIAVNAIKSRQKRENIPADITMFANDTQFSGPFEAVSGDYLVRTEDGESYNIHRRMGASREERSVKAPDWFSMVKEAGEKPDFFSVNEAGDGFFSNKTIRLDIPSESELIKCGRYAHTKDGKRWFVRSFGELNNIRFLVRCRSQRNSTLYYEATDVWHKVVNPPVGFRQFLLGLPVMGTNFESIYSDHRLVFSDNTEEWSMICADGEERDFVAYRTGDTDDELCLSVDNVQWMKFLVLPSELIEYIHKKLGYNGKLYKALKIERPKRSPRPNGNDSGVKKMQVVHQSDNLTVIPIFGCNNSIVHSTDKNKWFINLNGDYTSIVCRLEFKGQESNMLYYKAPETWHKIKNPPIAFVKFLHRKVSKVFNGSTDFEDLYRSNDRLVISDQNGHWTIICQDGFEREFVKLGECEREDGFNLTTVDKQWYVFVVPPDDFVQFIHDKFNYTGWLYQIMHPEEHGKRAKRNAPFMKQQNDGINNSCCFSDKLVVTENGTQWSVRTDHGLKKVMYKLVGESKDSDGIFYEATDGWHKTRRAPKAFKNYLQQLQVVKPYFKEMYWSNRRLVCSDDDGEWSVLCGDGIERDFIAVGRDHHFLINATVDNKKWFLFRNPPDNFILFINKKLNYTGQLYQSIINDSISNVSRAEYHYISNPPSSFNHSLLNATYKRQILSKRWLVVSEDSKQWFIDSDYGLKRTFALVQGRAKDFPEAIFYEASDGWHKMRLAPKEFKEYLIQSDEVNPDFEDPKLSNNRLVISDDNGDWSILCRDGIERDFVSLNDDPAENCLNLTASNGQHFRFMNPSREFIRFVHEKFNYRGFLYQRVLDTQTDTLMYPKRETSNIKIKEKKKSTVYSPFDNTGRFVMRDNVCYVKTDDGEQRVRFRVQGKPKEINATLYEASDGWHKIKHPPQGLKIFLNKLIYVRPDFRELFWSNRRLVVSDDDGSWTCLCRDGIERNIIALGPDRNDIINATVENGKWYRFRDPQKKFVLFMNKKFNYTGKLYRWILEEEKAIRMRVKRETQQKFEGTAVPGPKKPKMNPVMINDPSVHLVPSEDGDYWFSKCYGEFKMVRFKIEAHGIENDAIFYEVSGGWRKTCKAPEAFKHYLNRLNVEKPNFHDLFSSNRRLVESDDNGMWTVVDADGQERCFVGFSSNDIIDTFYLTAGRNHWYTFLKPPKNFVRFVHDKFVYVGKLYQQLNDTTDVHSGLEISTDGKEWYLNTPFGKRPVQASVNGTSTDNDAIFFVAGDRWHKTTKAPFAFKVYLSKLPIERTDFEETFWSNTRLVESDDDGKWSVLCPDGRERDFVTLERDIREDVLNLTAGDNYCFRILNPTDDFVRYVHKKFKYTGKLYQNLRDLSDKSLGKKIKLGIVDWTGRFVISEDGANWSVQTDHGVMEIKYRIKGRGIEDDAIFYEAADGWHKCLMAPIMFKDHLSKLPIFITDFQDDEWSNRRLVRSDDYSDWTILCKDGNEKEFIAIGTDSNDVVNLTTDNKQWYQFKSPPGDFIRFLHKKLNYSGILYKQLDDLDPDVLKSYVGNETGKLVYSKDGMQWFVRTDSGLKLVRFRVRGKSKNAGSTIYEASDGWHKIAEAPEAFKRYLANQSVVKADFDELFWSNHRLVVSDDDGNWTVLCRDGIERDFTAVGNDEREDTLNLTVDNIKWYRFLKPPETLVRYINEKFGYAGPLYHFYFGNSTTLRTKRYVQFSNLTEGVSPIGIGQLVSDDELWYLSTDEGLKRIVSKVEGQAKNTDALFYEVHDGWHKITDAPIAFKEFLAKQPVENLNQDESEWSNHRLVVSDDDGSWTVICKDGLERDFITLNNDTMDDVLNLTADNKQCFRFLKPYADFVLFVNKKLNYTGKLFRNLNSSRRFKIFGHPVQSDDGTKWYVHTETGLKMVRFKVEGKSKDIGGVFYDIVDGWRKNTEAPPEFKQFLNDLNSSRIVTPDFNEQKWSNQRLVECDNDGAWSVLCRDGNERDFIGLGKVVSDDVVNITVGNSMWFQFHQPHRNFVRFLNRKFNYSGKLFKELLQKSYKIILDFNKKENGKNIYSAHSSGNVSNCARPTGQYNFTKPYSSEWLFQSPDGKFVWFVNPKGGRKKIQYRVAGIGIEKHTIFVGAEDGLWHKIRKAPPQFKEYIDSQVLVYPNFEDEEWSNKRLVMSEDGQEWSILCQDTRERDFCKLGVDESNDAFKIGVVFCDNVTSWFRFKKSPRTFEEFIRRKFKLAHSDDSTVWYINTEGGLKRVLCRVIGEGIDKNALFFEATDGLWHKITNAPLPFKYHLFNLNNKSVDVDSVWDNRRLVFSHDNGKWTALCSDGKEREFVGFIKNERLDVFNLLLSNKELFKTRNPPGEFVQYIHSSFIPVGSSPKNRTNKKWTLKKFRALEEKKHTFQGGDRFDISDGGKVGSIRTTMGPKKILFRVHGFPKEADALFFEASDGIHKVKKPPVVLQNFLILLTSMEPNFPDAWWANRRLVLSDEEEEWTFLRRDGIEQEFLAMSADIRSDILNVSTEDGQWYRFRDPPESFIRFVHTKFGYNGELFENMVLKAVQNARSNKTVYHAANTHGLESRRNSDHAIPGMKGSMGNAALTGMKSAIGDVEEIEKKVEAVIRNDTISVDEGLARLEKVLKQVKQIRDKQDADKTSTTTENTRFKIGINDLKKKSDLLKGSEEQFLSETRISHEAFTTPLSHRHNITGTYSTFPPEYCTLYDIDAKPYVHNLNYLLLTSDDEKDWFLRTVRGYMRIIFRVEGQPIEESAVFAEAEDNWWYKVVRVPDEFREFLMTRPVMTPDFEDRPWSDRRLVVTDDGENWTVLCRDGVERQFTALTMNDQHHMTVCVAGKDWLTLKQPPKEFVKYIEANFNYTEL